MRTSLLPLAALALALPFTAQAQFGIYGTVTVERMSGQQSSPDRFANTAYNSSVSPVGGTFGAFYDFRNVGPVRLGVDARGLVFSSSRGAETDSVGAGTRHYAALGGVRATFHTPFTFLRPYAQASAGLGRSNFGILGPTQAAGLPATSIQLRNTFEYHVYAGADIPLLPVMDFRVVELGYGAMTALGTGSHTYPLGSISTGIVFHLPSLP